jgi:hypothetical protein
MRVVAGSTSKKENMEYVYMRLKVSGFLWYSIKVSSFFLKTVKMDIV